MTDRNSKPWETETWRYSEIDGAVVMPLDEYVYSPTPEQGRLAAAAPDLARFARNVMQGTWTRDEGERVLANAGVPLPDMELSEEAKWALASLKSHEQLIKQRDELVRVLLGLRTMERPYPCWCGFGLGTQGRHSDTCTAARAALAKAGVDL